MCEKQLESKTCCVCGKEANEYYWGIGCKNVCSSGCLRAYLMWLQNSFKGNKDVQV